MACRLAPREAGLVARALHGEQSREVRGMSAVDHSEFAGRLPRSMLVQGSDTLGARFARRVSIPSGSDSYTTLDWGKTTRSTPVLASAPPRAMNSAPVR